LNKNAVLIVEQGEGQYDVPDIYDHNNKFVATGTRSSRSPSPSRSPVKMSNQELRKDRRFLAGELQDQTNERRMIEEYLEKVLREFNSFSNRHDQVCEFTLALQKNFLYVFENIKARNSDLLEDEEVREIYRRLAVFNAYETNFVKHLNKFITPKNNFSSIH